MLPPQRCPYRTDATVFQATQSHIVGERACRPADAVGRIDELPSKRLGSGGGLTRLPQAMRALAVPLLAAVLCAGAATWHYACFRADPQRLWGRMDHDRNTHYLEGLRLGLDLRHGRLLETLCDVHRLRTWPPLHALLVAATTFVAGADYRLAVLPNLAAWSASILLMFLVARRASPCAGTLAGTTAAFWMLSSPAHRALACDFMLESLGALLTLLVVHAYLGARARGQGMSRMLAVALTLLFYAKYNYWLIALGSVAICEAARHRAKLRTWATAEDLASLRRWLVDQRGRPLSWAFAVLAALCIASWIIGPEPRAVWGSLRLGGNSQNLWHLAFLALAARIAVHWRDEGAGIWKRLPPAWRTFALWHVAPSAAWFLLPKRLGYFVWYLSLDNGPNSEGGVSHALVYYWACIRDDYHLAGWSLAAASALALAACLRLPRMRAGAGVLLALLVLGTVLAATHPNRKSRFVHTWLPAGWAAAGTGLALLAGGAGPGKAWRRGAGWVATTSLWVAGIPHLAERPSVPDSGSWRFESSLAVCSQWLPWLHEHGPHAIFANLPVEDFATWTYLEAFPDRRPPEVVKPLVATEASIISRQFEEWLRATPVLRLVYLDVEPDSPLHFPGYAAYEQVPELLSRQGTFRPVRQVRLETLRCTISLWERGAASADALSGKAPHAPRR